ncbi:hypothetical protein SAICODRAFT_127000 [Saitoella complicata NRRL Y-17804]|uniref:uncharacterized protein n=1 Tax=Saitoella complicata (strain BCRC 22490 / CBS 7301 / JCM 7358 / NBRC 10748 / NRRL Y-17804) TaxID=698492 RepID=UPI00086735BC|nr:uncharacterized protein SAICODRAFT_127000 [Saitoella complicata NRRL Y-17804]ODQ52765.1 hypothetical protein SAICODRAFT_127000 [Saitoella complicata NRRL Y-17804]
MARLAHLRLLLLLMLLLLLFVCLRSLFSALCLSLLSVLRGDPRDLSLPRISQLPTKVAGRFPTQFHRHLLHAYTHTRIHHQLQHAYIINHI